LQTYETTTAIHERQIFALQTKTHLTLSITKLLQSQQFAIFTATVTRKEMGKETKR